MTISRILGLIGSAVILGAFGYQILVLHPRPNAPHEAPTSTNRRTVQSNIGTRTITLQIRVRAPLIQCLLFGIETHRKQGCYLPNPL